MTHSTALPKNGHLEAIQNQITGTVKDSVVYSRLTKLLAERGGYRFTCSNATGNAPAGNQVKRHTSPTPLSASSPSPSPPLPPPPAVSEQHQEVVVGLWDEVDGREINKHLDPVKAEDDEEQYSPRAQEHTRLQRLMGHEREMQNNLMSQLVAMHERISRENHLELTGQDTL
ncbi:hypothetical protein D9C73_011365 [Collichthys lucidus]|uniref:Uncharacterized protein n=1 Tax=Collichthys lucidus TaxID=240159 RepID=A0A4U5UQE9_COLLU|nr:hypothetical protein D9C73_011365 [Collichthys lucidus]